MTRWKYDLGDKVWFNAYGSRPTPATITGLLYDGSPGYQLRESDGGYVNQSEDRVYVNAETARKNVDRL